MKIRQTLKLRDRLYGEFARTVGPHPTGEAGVFDSLSRTAALETSLDLEQARQLVLQYPLLANPDADLRMLSSRLAGISEGLYPDGPPMNGFPLVPEWAGIELKRFSPYPSKEYGNPRLFGTFLVLQGAAAGLYVSRVFTKRFLWVLSRQLGFGKSKKCRWSGEPADFISFWMLASIYTKGDRLGFERYEVPAECLSHNKALIKARREPCPRGFRHACRDCPIGYDSCPNGTHADTWIVKPCCGVSGKKVLDTYRSGHEGYFDPDHLSNVCIECERRLTGGK